MGNWLMGLCINANINLASWFIAICYIIIKIIYIYITWMYLIYIHIYILYTSYINIYISLIIR
jgi:hypothetical protein